MHQQIHVSVRFKIKDTNFHFLLETIECINKTESFFSHEQGLQAT